MKATSTYFYILIIFMFTACEEGMIIPEVEKPILSDQIIYSKNPNGHNELYLLSNDEESLLMSDPDYDYWWPKVSPDRKKFLVYRSERNPDKNHDDYPNAELLLVDIDGSNQEVLIEKNQYGWNAQGVCRWNADGSKILMCAEVKVDVGFQWRLISTDSRGNNPKVLSDYWAIDCNYSIDNKQIVFMGFTDNKLTFDVSKLEMQIGDYDEQKNELTNIRALTDNSTRDHDPDFSPDGKQIVFSAGNVLYSNVDLVLYDVESGTESILHDDSSANGGSMCWSPGGEHVYFHSLKLLGHPFRIKVINVNTKEVSTLLEIEDNSHGFFHPEAF